jgi:predicted transcriptional regulator
MAAKIKADWERVAAHYRAGKRTLRDIGEEFGITESAIRKRAKAEGWPRDLSERIKAKADDMVRKSLVRKGAIGTTELEIEDANAFIQADIRTQQMVRATDNRKTIESMLDELKAQNASSEELSKLGELMDDPEAKGNKLSEMYNKVISFGGRVDSAKKLIESWVKATDSECKAFGINDEEKGKEVGQYNITISSFDSKL